MENAERVLYEKIGEIDNEMANLGEPLPFRENGAKRWFAPPRPLETSQNTNWLLTKAMVPKLPLALAYSAPGDARPLLRVLYSIICIMLYYGLMSRQRRICGDHIVIVTRVTRRKFTRMKWILRRWSIRCTRTRVCVLKRDTQTLRMSRAFT